MHGTKSFLNRLLRQSGYDDVPPRFQLSRATTGRLIFRASPISESLPY
jgi:hypothetical protein